MEVIAIIKLKQYMTYISVFEVAIGKFSHQGKICLVILLSVHKIINIYFYYTIPPFYLTVYPKLEIDRELLLNFEKIRKQKPELEEENRFVVADDRFREAVILHYYINNYLRKNQNIDGNFNRFVVHYFCEIIYINQN